MSAWDHVFGIVTAVLAGVFTGIIVVAAWFLRNPVRTLLDARPRMRLVWRSGEREEDE